MKKKKTITIEKIMSFNPCYIWPEEKIVEAIGGRAIDIIDFCHLKTVPHTDKLWLLLRPDYISDKNMRLLACTWAERVLSIFEKKYPGDGRPRAAIQVSRKFAEGLATHEELAAARAAARAASAAASDASAAARAAASAAAWAASAAASDAAWAAAWDEQIDNIVEVLKNVSELELPE